MHESPTTLEYASIAPARRPPPGWFAALLLAPVLFFPVLLFTSQKWFSLGQRWERICGKIWLATLAWSILAIVYHCYRPRSCWIWVCLALHILFITATILPPGCILLAWLMHWLSGPGA